MNKKTQKLVLGFVISGLVVVLFSTYMIFSQISNYRKSAHVYRDTAEQYVSTPKTIVVTHVESPKMANEPDKTVIDSKKTVDDGEESEDNWEKSVNVDLSGLQSINEDVIGWLYFENLDINYPVLYSGDDSTYLKRNYLNEKVQAGSIFMEGVNSKDFSDPHTLIYGHNMKDLSMFGKLRYYVLDDSFIEGHEYFQIITKEKKYRYRIISYKIVSDDSDVYTVYKTGGQDFLDFVKTVLQKGSYVGSDYNINGDDHLITLSTCSGEDRLVVSAVRCDESF